MVTPIGKLVNKLSFSFTPFSNSTVRKRNPLFSNNSSKDLFIRTFGCSTPYCERMDIDPNVAPSIEEIAYEHFELSYKMK